MRVSPFPSLFPSPRRLLRTQARRLAASVTVLAVALLVLGLLVGPWLVVHLLGPIAVWIVDIVGRVWDALWRFGRWVVELVS